VRTTTLLSIAPIANRQSPIANHQSQSGTSPDSQPHQHEQHGCKKTQPSVTATFWLRQRIKASTRREATEKMYLLENNMQLLPVAA
jgi:hypothetical protein